MGTAICDGASVGTAEVEFSRPRENPAGWSDDEFHPRGAHAEVRAILDEVSSQLDSLQWKEERAQEQEVKRADDQEKRAEREACKKDCLGIVRFSLKPEPFEICMGGA